MSVFAECAEMVGIDLHRHGIRIVECSQAGGPKIFIKVADTLGIGWHLAADGDEGGKKYADDAKELLNGKQEVEHISVLTYPNIDILLCCSGYGEPYRKGVGPQKVGELTARAGTLEYWKQVYKIINNKRDFSKPEAALESIMLMKDKGEHGVPNEVKGILDKCTALVAVD